MDSNIYAAPSADLVDETQQTLEHGPNFYVVSKRKFYILNILTIGLYQTYWFYRQWKAVKDFHRSSIWPVARTIFALFFTHSLCDAVDEKITRSTPDFKWKYHDKATLLVVMLFFSSVCSRLSYKGVGSPYTDISLFIFLAIESYLIFFIQNAVNIAAADTEGKQNDSLTAANWVWISIGILLWVFSLIGIFLPESLAA